VKRLATIGFGKKSAQRFVELLTGADVDVVIDTRRRPDSPLSGYARKRDLPYILDAAGIAYEHHLELAPPDDLLQRYRSDKDWDAYVVDYDRRVLSTAEANDAMRTIALDTRVSALLCSEPTPEKCHRRLLADRMNELLGPLEIRHLV
jgi:uncharacterized protein (DUF488 family)